MSEMLLKLYTGFLGILISLSSVFVTATEKIPFLDYKISNYQKEITIGTKNPEILRIRENDTNPTEKTTLTPTTTVLLTASTSSPLRVNSKNTEIIPPVKKPSPYIQTAPTAPSTIAIDTYEDDDTSVHAETFKKPCSQVIGYRIGTFDSRFDISKDDFLRLVNEASSLWSNKHGSTLFVYNDQGPLTVNLVYDGRQERTKENKLLANEITNTKEAAEAIETIYEKDKITYTQQAEQHTQEVSTYNAKFKSYDARVVEHNKHGGATKEEYDRMMLEKEELTKESLRLEENRKTLLALVEAINIKIKKHNEFIAYANSLIQESNTFGAKKFTEGIYNPATKSITIYQYTDFIKLKRVLAHEFGHVLAIGHTKDKESIMHYLNTGVATTLTQEDTVALRASCAQ